MDKPDIDHAAPATLSAELERSREDLAAGRLTPLHVVLTAIQARAKHRQAARTEKQTLPEPG